MNFRLSFSPVDRHGVLELLCLRKAMVKRSCHDSVKLQATGLTMIIIQVYEDMIDPDHNLLMTGRQEACTSVDSPIRNH